MSTIDKIKVNGVEFDVGGSGGESGESGNSGVLEAAITANTNFGGITAGKKYGVGTAFETILRDMLVKYIAPGVSISITPNTTIACVGDRIDSVTIKASVKKNSKPITSVKFYVAGTLVNTITSGVSNGGTFEYVYAPSVGIVSTTSFYVVVSDGDTSITSESKTITFVHRSYIGTVDDSVSEITESVVKGLDSVLLTGKGYTKSGISVGYGKVLYAYPKSYGSLSSIKDGNNVQYINSYVRSEISIDGVAYYCYLLKDSAGLSNFTQIFA